MFCLLQCVEYLLFCGANKDSEDYRGWTALHYAAHNGFHDILILLIVSPGSKRTYRDRLGFTPLHAAIRSNHFDCVYSLVEEGPCPPPGAERNAATNDGNTPLHLAALLGHLHIVKFLISVGADANVMNLSKKYPVDVAMTYDLREYLKPLTTSRKSGFLCFRW